MSQDLLKIAISAALEAAKEILKIYHSDDFEVQLKSDDSIAQAVGVNQGRDMRNLLGNGGKSGKMGGKDYNLNFNLE